MTIHYPVESLPELFLSEKYISDKSSYSLNNLQEVNSFLNSIEINKQYYRTGIIVKNPKYKKRVSDDTIILKEFKTSLNKLSSINYEKICESIVSQVRFKNHLYPLILEITFEHALLHHSYSKFYCHLINLLHKVFCKLDLIYKQIDISYKNINQLELEESSEYTKLCNKNIKIDKLIGYCLLLSELECINIIEEKTEPLISTLIENMKNKLPEDEMYKCVICLYTLCKQKYDIAKIKAKLSLNDIL